jgi:hypothetical protein
MCDPQHRYGFEKGFAGARGMPVEPLEAEESQASLEFIKNEV